VAFQLRICLRDALYRLFRALASIGVTEETTPKHFRRLLLANRCGGMCPSPPGQPSSFGPIQSEEGGKGINRPFREKTMLESFCSELPLLH
jgi:hypothetical protein